MNRRKYKSRSTVEKHKKKKRKTEGQKKTEFLESTFTTIQRRAATKALKDKAIEHLTREIDWQAQSIARAWVKQNKKKIEAEVRKKLRSVLKKAIQQKVKQTIDNIYIGLSDW